MSRRWRITEAPEWKDDFVPGRSAKAGVGVYVRSSLLQVDLEVAEAGIPACFVRDAGGKPTRFPPLEFISSKALVPGTLYRDRPLLPEGLTAPTLVPG